MSIKIGVEELSDAVKKDLEEYSKLSDKQLKASVLKVAKETCQQIKDTAPRRTGAYAESWTTKKTRETPNGLEMTIYSKDQYQLSHLLENGHALRQGGRSPAFPHIAPAEQAGIAKLEEEVKKVISDG